MWSLSLSPVMKMTGTCAIALFCLSRRQVENPSPPGMMASIRMTSDMTDLSKANEFVYFVIWWQYLRGDHALSRERLRILSIVNPFDVQQDVNFLEELA